MALFFAADPPFFYAGSPSILWQLLLAAMWLVEECVCGFEVLWFAFCRACRSLGSLCDMVDRKGMGRAQIGGLWIGGGGGCQAGGEEV